MKTNVKTIFDDLQHINAEVSHHKLTMRQNRELFNDYNDYSGSQSSSYEYSDSDIVDEFLSY